jgi:hypothetical protein
VSTIVEPPSALPGAPSVFVQFGPQKSGLFELGSPATKSEWPVTVA